MAYAASVSATTLQAADIALQVVAHNLSNQQSTAFQGSNVALTDLVYQDVISGSSPSSEDASHSEFKVGSGVRVASTLRNMQRGLPEHTKNPLDLYINGSGYLRVKVEEGRFAYTRAGNLKIDEDGKLLTASNYEVDPGITIDMREYDSVLIDKSGRFFGVDPKQEGAARYVELGRLDLWRFRNPQGLLPREDTLFLETEASGDPQAGSPTENGFGGIMQGYIERSNVNAPMQLVKAISIKQWSDTGASIIQIAEKMEDNSLRQISAAI